MATSEFESQFCTSSIFRALCKFTLAEAGKSSSHSHFFDFRAWRVYLVAELGPKPTTVYYSTMVLLCLSPVYFNYRASLRTVMVSCQDTLAAMCSLISSSSASPALQKQPASSPHEMKSLNKLEIGCAKCQSFRTTAV